MACASCCAAGPGERGRVRELPCEDLFASDDPFGAAARPGDEAPSRDGDGATPAKQLSWRAAVSLDARRGTAVCS